jgi:sigma-B regulation protein RsbU (phosphoserine phosphatase)
MIGAFDFTGWSEDSVTLNADDFLLIFTDGVTEAEKDDDFYGDDRLEQLAIDCREQAPNELAHSIVKDVEKYVEDTPRSDDITMLIIKRND